MKRIEILFLLSLSAAPALAQTDALGPLHARPQQAVHQRGQLKNGLNEWFVYQYLPQSLPIMDDFSSDRTRHRDAQSGDADVSFQETVYRLSVGGVSTADMKFMIDPTYTYTFDVQQDTTIIDTIENAALNVDVFDITSFPSSSQPLTLWPAYTIYDTLGGNSVTDTIDQADYVQDSLLVYSVAAMTDLYDCAPGAAPVILWEDDDVYVNGGYPVDPPTVGVATFEGLDRTGYPYDFDVPTAYGLCDQLTSVPINMLGPASDSVYLSFFYQPQGLSGDNIPQSEDSLRLEFYAPDDDLWYLVWSKAYEPLKPFEQVMLKIEQQRYLKNGFRMRFSNVGTRSGALDHWHLDYVRLARQRTFDDTIIVDVAYVMPESSILDLYTSVPYTHFAANPASYMINEVVEPMKNLDVNDRFVEFGMSIGRTGQAPSLIATNGLNISGNASSTFGTLHSINSAPNNFIYDAPTADTCASWDVAFWRESIAPDINKCNDTIRFRQDLTSYYAYDDGSAEAGYFVNTAGAKVAHRFDISTTDTLRAVRIYFDPIFEDPSASSFLLTVWSSVTPEAILYQNATLSNPEYVRWGPNTFVEYLLDDEVVVSGTFFVGFVQTTAAKLNVGFDRNRDNGDKVYYKVSGPFAQSTQEGSLMLRPVFKAKKDPFLGIEPPSLVEVTLQLYPNPAQDVLNIAWAGTSGVRVEMLDATGRLLHAEQATTTIALNTTNCASGVYMVRLRDLSGAVLATERFVVQR